MDSRKTWTSISHMGFVTADTASPRWGTWRTARGRDPGAISIPLSMHLVLDFNMSDVLLTLPEASLAGSRLSRDRLEESLRKELALHLYREGLVTHAGACRMAGLEKAAFQYLLGERGIPQQLRAADLDEEMDHWRRGALES